MGVSFSTPTLLADSVSSSAAPQTVTSSTRYQGTKMIFVAPSLLVVTWIFQFRFLLSLLEAGFERLELGAEFEGSGFAGAAFMCACAEAMRECGVRSPTFFRLTEIVGVLCSDENVADCASGLCDLVGLRLAI